MKEIENIRRDMAYRLKQAQTTAEEGRRGSEEKVERMERELEESRKVSKVLQEKEVRREGRREGGREAQNGGTQAGGMWLALKEREMTGYFI